MNAMNAIDPQWAWSAWGPDQGNWDRRSAAHLYRRAGFAASRATLDEAIRRTPADVVAELLDLSREPESFRQQIDALVTAALATENVQQLSAQWAYRMLHSPVPLLEQMTLFWHGHFATSAAKVGDAQLMQQQNELLRRHALGNFAELSLEISRDPAMLIYLDSASNRKAHPNENYARELMELFCLGEGNYSEGDIRELARCFTGWEVKRNQFRFNRYQHDRGTKSVLGQTGSFGGEAGVAIVLDQPAAPRFIAKELVRYFVMDEPVASDALIEPLAVALREDNLQVGPTVQRILRSNLFFSPLAIGRKVRSPVELGIGFLRALDGSANMIKLAAAFERLGQGLFLPPSVKGWDGGRTWINSSTLIGRNNLIGDLVADGKTRFQRTSLSEFMQSQGIDDPQALVDWIETDLFAVPVPLPAREQVASIFSSHNDPERRYGAAIHLLCSLPEFQLA